MLRLIDSHCHLEGPAFLEDRPEILRRAAAAGVTHVVNVATDLETSEATADSGPGIRGTCGVHPHDVAQAGDGARDQVAALLEEHHYAAVGETGLDYHYDHSPRSEQREAFLWHGELARIHGLPLVVHSRDAWEDTSSCLDEITQSPGEPDIVLHCFTGGPAEAERMLALGAHISFSGILTFASADAVREAARMVPPERLLVETDAPYLAPVPHRGERCEPAHVKTTLECLAGVRGEDPSVTAAATWENAARIFGLEATPPLD